MAEFETRPVVLMNGSQCWERNLDFPHPSLQPAPPGRSLSLVACRQAGTRSVGIKGTGHPALRPRAEYVANVR